HAAFIHALTGDFLSNTLLYIVTFAVLASYWLNHRRLMNIVTRVDRFFLWLNLLFLAFVAFFPIAANVSKYSQFPEAVIVYTVVLAGCGYCVVLLWIYALGNHRLVAADRDVNSHKSRIIRVAITPTFFLASLLLLFIPNFPPSSVFYSWLLLPFIHRFWNIFWKKSK
ncbi:MAG TPA: TMEM175 family protein, partial [Ktedonobacteraceae bacterium]|nr:TMEM175 family protein [Ktedonobacteraceae bacterium]